MTTFDNSNLCTCGPGGKGGTRLVVQSTSGTTETTPELSIRFVISPFVEGKWKEGKWTKMSYEIETSDGTELSDDAVLEVLRIVRTYADGLHRALTETAD